MITGEQVTAARVLLNWSQFTLANSAGLDFYVIIDCEAGRHEPNPEDKVKIKRALEAAGIVFIPQNGGCAGVRLLRPSEG